MTFSPGAETADRLVALAEGRLSREGAADWARPHITDESVHPQDMDRPVWDALRLLLGADVRSAPGEYLHAYEDYATWLAEFRQASP